MAGGTPPPPPPPPVEYITTLQPNDVCSGRGGATNSWPGNRAFRLLVKQYQQQYLTAKKRDKPAVASEIVQVIRQRGGRFVRRCPEPYRNMGSTTNPLPVVWVDIGDDRAREKTCQALREGAPEMRRKYHVEPPMGDAASSPTKPTSPPSKTPFCNADEPIVIRPCQRWMPHREDVAPIPLDELSTEDRDLYLRDFYPPTEQANEETATAPWSIAAA